MSFLNRWGQCLAWLCALALSSAQVQAEDIDIFVGNTTVDTGLPNVIFVLDNTSNWARQNQQWPGGLAQGQSEVRAIKTALADLEGKVNVGLVEFTTDGNANQDGGFVRFNLQTLTDGSRSALNTTLENIFNDINGPTEKRNSNTPYGNLMYDVYNYLAGEDQSYAGGGTNAANADESAYAVNYSKFLSPLSADSACGKTYLIFIGNPNASGPSDDSGTNSAALAALYAGVDDTPDGLAGSSGNPQPIGLPEFTVTTETIPPTNLGYSAACYKSNEASVCTEDQNEPGGLCVGKENCFCDATNSINTGGVPGCITQGAPKNQTARFAVLAGGSTTTTVTETGAVNTTKGRPWNFDDWAKFLNVHGIPVQVTTDEGPYTQRVPVITYTIDVFNAQQNADHSALMFSGAKAGGGRYFQARNEDAIVDAINTALSDILSVSSTFAAVTLPLSATNRAQSKNQVYIGMFRPDQSAKPRWFGNLKRYQIGIFDGEPGLADAQAEQAINPISGFAAECAESFWTTDSGVYWQALGITPPPQSQCLGSPYSVWSDLPDGPFVEKGGVAQVSRESDLVNRSLLTVDNGSLASMTDAAAVGGDTILNYLKGTTAGLGEVAADEGGRPSIHGDVVHSRPLTLNYGGTTGTYIFYGSNDGLYRAIRAKTGGEPWSLIAPEHYDGISRLYSNSPLVDFPNQNDATAEPKDYFFDGSTGHVITYDADDVVDTAWIYPTMRRGGRMIYGLNVTDPLNPVLLWRLGCPSLDNDVGCSTGFSGIGQTWSTPVSTKLGYTGSPAVLIFGGGYDNCLDTDQVAYPCSETAKGRGVYVLNAQTGTLLAGPATLATEGPVVGDVALADFNQDGTPDFGYVADAKGGLYRINFSQIAADGSVGALAPGSWSLTKVAEMSGDTRRFFNTPAVLALQDAVYVALGSGNRERPLESNYPYQNDVDDRFYVFVDFPGTTSATVDLDGDQLLNVTPAADLENCTPAEPKPRGWFTSLEGQGEQVVNPAAIAGGQVFFNTYRPGGSSVGVCTRPLGVAQGCAVDLFNPSSCQVDRCREIAGGGMPIAPVITTVCVGCNAGVPDPETGELIFEDPDHVDGSIVANLGENPDGSSVTKDVTICIGCQGLEPLPIKAAPPTSRQRTYWNSDVDR